MTDRLKTTLAELVTMAREGNRHALPTLRQILDVTSDWRDRQQVTLAIAHAEGRHAPKAAPALNPTVFEMPAATARLWEIVTNAGRN